MQLPTPLSKPFSSLIVDIENGQIKIPQFQRDFVWTMQKSAGLIDSLVKGYPIGTFIFWRTKERLRSIRNLGDIELPETPEGDSVDFVLDGQQRLTSIFACLKGIKVKRENKEDDFSKIYIDLDADENQLIVITEINHKKEKTFISILDLMNGAINFFTTFDEKYHEKMQTYKSTINSYQYSIIQLVNAPMDIATEVFTRINVGGKPLTVFEIMVAKTFDEKRNFDLAEKYQKFMDELDDVGYETVSDATVLQTISIIMAGECKRSIILNLDKQRFIDAWDDAIVSIKGAVEYFRNYYRIPVSQLLPYNALIVPFAYFFFKHTDKPTGDKQKYLEDFFWRCSLSGRYSSTVESKIAQDVKRIDTILNGNLPSYDDPIDTSANFIKDNGWFNSGRSYIKAILCIYAYHQPKSFIDDSIVNIRNNWLKRADSKNYHHFFPKAYLKKKKEEESRINHILNITIVDDFLNKREIRAKSPSVYMGKFARKNSKLPKTMKTHLIDELEGFGIWADDFGKFFDARANLLARKIDKRIIKQEIDKRRQAELGDDFEEDITVTE